MTFYHGTSAENWKAIQEEGVLFGKQYYKGKLRRFTYLATHAEDAAYYGDVVLEVEFNPFKKPKRNNYVGGCWQMRVYEPIDIKNVKRIK